MSHKTSDVANLAHRHKNKCHWSHNWSVLAIQCLDYDNQSLILEFLCCVCSCQATLKYSTQPSRVCGHTGNCGDNDGGVGNDEKPCMTSVNYTGCLSESPLSSWLCFQGKPGIPGSTGERGAQGEPVSMRFFPAALMWLLQETANKPHAVKNTFSRTCNDSGENALARCCSHEFREGEAVTV